MSLSGVTIDRYGLTIVDLKKIGYKEEPFVLAKDVSQVFYVNDMSSKRKQKPVKRKQKKSEKESETKPEDDEPKRHIVLPGKRKILELKTLRTCQRILIN